MTEQFEQEHMPVCQLTVAGWHGERPVGCDYCDNDAAWHHWADKRNVNRDAWACDEHVTWLNRYALNR